MNGTVMITFLREFRDNDSGATAIEYGIFGALIGVVIIGSLTMVGRRIEANMHCTYWALGYPHLANDRWVQNCIDYVATR